MPNENLTERPLFIHSAVDDYGFSPAEFRVLCAIVRRGECFERVALLAERCRLGRKAVWAALNHLEQRGVIARVRRHGRTSVFSVRSMDHWEQPVPNGDPTPKRTSTCPQPGPATRPLLGATEGYPIKLLPRRKPHDYSQGF